MTAKTLEGKWHQLKGMMRQKWGRLTDDDVTFIFGSWERAVGKLQERYGWKYSNLKAFITYDKKSLYHS